MQFSVERYMNIKWFKMYIKLKWITSFLNIHWAHIFIEFIIWSIKIIKMFIKVMNVTKNCTGRTTLHEITHTYTWNCFQKFKEIHVDKYRLNHSTCIYSFCCIKDHSFLYTRQLIVPTVMSLCPSFLWADPRPKSKSWDLLKAISWFFLTMPHLLW